MSDAKQADEAQERGSEGKTEERSPEEIEAEIESTREELGDTVEALAHKTDVKAQAQEKAAEAKEQAAQKADEVKQRVEKDPKIAIATGVAALIVVVGLIRRRTRR